MGKMQNLSSVIGDAPAAIGAVAVLLMGLWTWSVESNTVSISEQSAGTKPEHGDLSSLPKAV